MTLIEKLISEPNEEIISQYLDDENFAFWVDWREDDSELAGVCEDQIETGKLSSEWDNDKLIIKYGDVTKEVPLTNSASDRHITLVTINEILKSEYEVRFVWDSDGGDTIAFTILPSNKWEELESKYGVDVVSRAFLKLTPNLNTFTDSLYNKRPTLESKKKWWKFW